MLSSSTSKAKTMLSSILTHQKKQRLIEQKERQREKARAQQRQQNERDTPLEHFEKREPPSKPPKPPSPKSRPLIKLEKMKRKIEEKWESGQNPIASFYTPEPPKPRPLPNAATAKGISKKKKYAKLCMQYMFSHVGLCFLIVGYCMLGAVIFKAIEGPNELERLNETFNAALQVETMKEEMKLRIQGISSHENSSQELIREWLQEYQNKIREVIKTTNQSYSGEMMIVEDAPRGWTFPGALLFSVSIISLIGYGHIAPVTELGQLTVILYALFGVPLTLIFLSNIGQLMADIIRMSFHRGFCRLCKAKRTESRLSRKISAVIVVEEEELEHEFRSVPISFTAGILVIYVAMGIGLFSLMDGWASRESLYFSFITISTIGFGDYIPGWHDFSPLGQFKMVVSSFYIILGMAVLSMGFNLIVEVLFRTAETTVKKLGMKDDEDELMNDQLTTENVKKSKDHVSNLSRAVRRNKIK